MSLYCYFKPLHSELQDQLAHAKIAGDHNRSIDAWCECAWVRVTGSYEEKYITGCVLYTNGVTI